MANWGSGAAGLLGGAGTGALAGSAFGPIGTGVGAGFGALVGGASGLFGGRPEVNRQQSKFSPQIQSQLEQLLGKQLNSAGQNKFDFAPIEQQARTNLQQKTLPSIAERFSSIGARGSSAFNNALGQAGAGLEESLASLKSQYGLQQEGQQNQLLQMLLSLGGMENIYHPEQGGFIDALAPGVGQGLGKALPGMFQSQLDDPNSGISQLLAMIRGAN